MIRGLESLKKPPIQNKQTLNSIKPKKEPFHDKEGEEDNSEIVLATELKRLINKSLGHVTTLSQRERDAVRGVD